VIGKPVLAEELEEHRGEWHKPILPPLSLADVDRHALTVEVTDFEVGTLRDTKSCGVDGHQYRTVLHVDYRAKQPPDLVDAEDDR
jgi:hypothetical protein